MLSQSADRYFCAACRAVRDFVRPAGKPKPPHYRSGCVECTDAAKAAGARVYGALVMTTWLPIEAMAPPEPPAPAATAGPPIGAGLDRFLRDLAADREPTPAPEALGLSLPRLRFARYLVATRRIGEGLPVADPVLVHEALP